MLDSRQLDFPDFTMTLLVYLVGWLILIAGVCWALISMHVSHHAVAVTAVIMLGIAVLTGATRTRTRDR
jgi:apolipoprotein N-acyltransferase